MPDYTITLPEIVSAGVSPGTVAVGGAIRIAVGVTEIIKILYPEQIYAGEVFAGEVIP